jgi:hypothetical protein
MKVKLREKVYIPIPTEGFTCIGCVFLSANNGICKAPDSIYTSCFNGNQLFHHSQKFSKIFDL